jgi:hypothetical protein
MTRFARLLLSSLVLLGQDAGAASGLQVSARTKVGSSKLAAIWRMGLYAVSAAFRKQQLRMKQPVIKFSMLVGILLAVISAGSGTIWVLVHKIPPEMHRQNAPQRAVVTEMHRSIPLGAGPDEVLVKVLPLLSDKLTLVTNQASWWRVHMPFEWRATDWELHVHFESGRVVSVLMRTSDGPAPTNGPPDKTVESRKRN